MKASRIFKLDVESSMSNNAEDMMRDKVLLLGLRDSIVELGRSQETQGRESIYSRI